MTAHLYIGDITVRCVPINKQSRYKRVTVHKPHIPLVLEEIKNDSGEVESYRIPREHYDRKMRYILMDEKKKKLMIKKENWNKYRFIYDIPVESVKFSSNIYNRPNGKSQRSSENNRAK